MTSISEDVNSLNPCTQLMGCKIIQLLWKHWKFLNLMVRFCGWRQHFKSLNTEKFSCCLTRSFRTIDSCSWYWKICWKYYQRRKIIFTQVQTLRPTKAICLQDTLVTNYFLIRVKAPSMRRNPYLTSTVSENLKLDRSRS